MYEVRTSPRKLSLRQHKPIRKKKVTKYFFPLKTKSTRFDYRNLVRETDFLFSLRVLAPPAFYFKKKRLRTSPSVGRSPKRRNENRDSFSNRSDWFDYPSSLCCSTTNSWSAFPIERGRGKTHPVVFFFSSLKEDFLKLRALTVCRSESFHDGFRGFQLRIAYDRFHGS